MRIVLIAPKNPESFWTFDRILPSLGKRCVFPNLSLPTVAGLTPREHDVVLVDENVEEIDFDVEADVIGVTGYVIHRARILEIVAEFRRRGRFVVVGGPYASLCPEELDGVADVLFVDEAEETWPRFLRDYQEGRHRAVYAAEEKPSMLDSPLPRFDLLKVDRYRTITVQFARGCPFTCEFCDIIVMYGRKPRAKSVAQIMAEIEEIHRLGVPNIFLVDDNFIGNKKLAKEALRAIGDWQRANGYPIEFMTEVSLNVADDAELLQGLRDANFTAIFIGIESPRRESLLETRKTQNARGDILESVRRVQAHGIQVYAGMIVGFDHDDPSIFEEQFRFIQDARIPISMTGMLNAMPKTPLHRRLRDAGRLLAGNVGDQFVFTNVVPKMMSRLELYAGYKDLLQRLYSFRNYRRRAMAFVLSRGEVVRTNLLAARSDVALFRRIVRDCILQASPRRAWMSIVMFVHTILRRPSAIRETLALILMHKHFYEYTRDITRQIDRLMASIREGADVMLPGEVERPRLLVEARPNGS